MKLKKRTSRHVAVIMDEMAGGRDNGTCRAFKAMAGIDSVRDIVTSTRQIEYSYSHSMLSQKRTGRDPGGSEGGLLHLLEIYIRSSFPDDGAPHPV
jgi:hypothetical protein